MRELANALPPLATLQGEAGGRGKGEGEGEGEEKGKDGARMGLCV